MSPKVELLAVVGMDNVGLLARLQGTVVIISLTGIVNCVTASPHHFHPYHHPLFRPFSIPRSKPIFSTNLTTTES